jgi:uncharacterized protein (DUF885 family)
MNRFSHLAALGLAMLTLTGCGVPAPPPARGADPAAPADRLGRMVERYWDENAALIPWYSWGGADMQFGDAPGESISPQSLADSLDLERRYFAEVSAVPRSSLSTDAKLTYDIFRRERALAIESFTYPLELLPINPYDGMPQQFALMASAAETHALLGAREYDNWNSRALGFVSWTNQAIANLRDGMRRGITIPRVSVEKALAQLAALGEDTPGNVFYQPLRPVPGAAADAEQLRLRGAMTMVLKDKILPSYRVLHDFLQREYLSRSRASVGLSALPLGDAWYGYLARRATGSALTPAQLHALGVSEVERLHDAVRSLLADASFSGNPQAYFDLMRRDPRYSYTSPEELFRAYQDIKVQVASATPALFSALPRADFGIRSVEAFREASTPALSYRPRAPNGIIPATLYVNTAQLDARPATAVASGFLHEAVPGHHYQLAIQRERADLPRFRRFGGAPAFIEGWGLYAETLGDELGIYHDNQAKFAVLLAELRCAAGLVIDTGVHAQGWTRAQALDYLRAQVPMDDADAQETVDRAVALPARALACTVGFLKIKGLRTFAQQNLGGRFDLRAFHAEIINDGAMPLDLLETKLKWWVSTELAAPPKEVAAPSKLD